MYPPPLLKILKFHLYFNYMHVSSVLQYFQFLFTLFYTVFSHFLYHLIQIFFPPPYIFDKGICLL
ncbi:hypothetical protein F8160_26160 [Bacillus sp. CH126_4D]|nr:hypothetical protein F8162_01815 [Bacillus sp. CH140a_4T]KAB2469248.1 hypothetical protein F8160_26160 [Bacillus sp. CH126_4D]